MMDIKIIEILILIISIVYIWEHSGFMYDLGKFLYTKLNKGKRYKGQPIVKPFGCYTCMVFWVSSGYYYLLIDSNVVYSLGIGVLASLIALLVDKILMVVIRAINKIE